MWFSHGFLFLVLRRAKAISNFQRMVTSQLLNNFTLITIKGHFRHPSQRLPRSLQVLVFSSLRHPSLVTDVFAFVVELLL